MTGPTGSGKTQICLKLPAEQYEVVSFDSRQVYKYLQLGTAKPSKHELEQIPHHLVDFLEPSQTLNAKVYSELAEEVVLQIWEKNKIPILTAGTGFYLKAFLHGMYQVPEVSEEVQTYLNQLSKEEKLNLLKEKDPYSFQKIHPNDSYRIHRALEIYFSGKVWAELSKSKENGFLEKFHPEVEGFFIDWPRALLYERINQRAKQILELGLLEETKFVAQKFGKDCPALKSLGYSSVLEFLEGLRDKDSLLEEFSRAHRNYAKKQITWFKKEPFVKPVTFRKILDFFML